MCHTFLFQSPCALRPDDGSSNETTEMGAGGVPKGSKTSDYYHVHTIPIRFDNPGMNIYSISIMDGEQHLLQ
jgi:hypothetical protein